MPFIILFLLIIVHELGHFITAVLFKIEPDKIYIYPFGGISKLNISLSESITKELIVLIAGPLTQFIFYLLLIKLPFFEHYKEIIKIYNYTILGFNLLPIYPLDGGKIINLLFSIKKSFRKSLLITLYISYITIIIFSFIFILNDVSLNIIIIISFLIYKVNTEWKNKKYLNDKFLLERYLHNYRFKKRKYVSGVDQFMRNKSHILRVNGKYYTEKEALYNKFHNKY